MKTIDIVLSAVLLTGLSANVALAGGDATAGHKKSQVCQACHGEDGKGTNPTYPVLAGQHADYLEQALKAYRDGSRKNPIMAGMAAALSDQDIADLSAYYAGMDGLKDLSIK